LDFVLLLLVLARIAGDRYAAQQAMVQWWQEEWRCEREDRPEEEKI
jgi:hypothetical protein